jgi:hypothetical protein
MLGTSCNEKNCPGWKSALMAGVVLIVMMMSGVVNDAFAGDVRVEIKRELPDETQHIVQQFYDEDSFAMWMSGKLEGEGCDPYVTEIKIFRNYQPDDQ